MAKTTKKSVQIARLNTLDVLLEKIDLLNSFPRKNRSTKASLLNAINEAREKVTEIKENLR